MGSSAPFFFVVVLFPAAALCKIDLSAVRVPDLELSWNEEGFCDGDSCKSPKAGDDVDDAARKCKMFDREAWGPDSNSIMYGEAKGRFGNQLLAYAVLQHFRNVVGMDAYIKGDAKEYLSKIFTRESITMPLLEETYCNPKDIPWETYFGHIRDLLTDPKYRKGRAILFYPQVKGDPNFTGGYKPESHQCKEQDVMQRAYVKYIRKNLKWKPHIQTKVRKIQKQVAKQMGMKPKEITYVGVHNRRTDGIEFIKRGYHQDELGAEYFHDAFDYFREDLEDEDTTPAFMYVSDDMDWGRKNIRNDHGDVFFVGEGDEEDDSIAFDLAVLRFANATIITRGTYSMWGSVLCEGDYYTEYGPIIADVT